MHASALPFRVITRIMRNKSEVRALHLPGGIKCAAKLWLLSWERLCLALQFHLAEQCILNIAIFIERRIAIKGDACTP